jgi:hypothetical protein
MGMEGINPTLAFLALMFGISGNARDDAANDPAMNIDIDRRAGCPILMITGDPPQPASEQNWEAFWDSAGSGAILPEVIDPKWADPGFPELVVSEPAGDLASLALDHGADPIERQPVPTSQSVAATDIKDAPCAPER